MPEIELKFQVPAASRRAVASAVAGAERPHRVRLRAAYFDTAGRALARAGLALRVRREGRRWVQTLKGAGDDGLTRDEHNVPLPPAGAEPPTANPALHAGTAVGERLSALLAAADAAGEGSGLLCSYRTDIRRRVRRVAVGEAAAGDGGAGAVPADRGTVELAFDEGAILAGDRRLAVCELEIEWLDGSPLAVIAAASAWVERHGLWLDTRSKAERGDLLARGETVAPPHRAAPLRLAAGTGVAAAWRAVLLNCVEQVARNASQVADGAHGPEHLHQLRVGLRRLRSALRLFWSEPRPAVDDAAAQARASTAPDRPADEAARIGEQAALLFRSLGAARDADAIGGPVALALRRALLAVGLPDDELPAASPAGAAVAVDPSACVRGLASQQLLLGLLRLGQRPAGDAPATGAAHDGARALRRLLAGRLRRWHRAVKRDARQFAALDDAARHRLRKRVKRLRYAVEFVAALYPKKATAAYLRRLRRLQDRLGSSNDLAVAIEAYRPAAATEPRALFALGWLAARREAVLREAADAADAFTAVDRFWRRRR